MKKLSLAYFGANEHSAWFLAKLLQDKEVSIKVNLVVTQPDRKVGRKQILTPNPVKLVAEKNVILVSEAHTESGRSWTSQDDLKKTLSQIDLAFVLFFGQIVSKQILDLPKYGFWNLHFSHLPKYRGGLPHVAALINGDKKVGLTIFKMDTKLDHGPLIVQDEIVVDPKDRRPDVEEKATQKGYEMFKRLINRLRIANYELKLKPQDHSQATYTKILKKSDSFIDIENLKLKIANSPQELFNLFRGFYPWPGIWTLVPSQKQPGRLRLKITDMDLVDGKIVLKTVQLEGKKEVDFKIFNTAYNLL